MRIPLFVAIAAFCLKAQQPAAIAPVHESVFVTGIPEPTPFDEADRNINALPISTKQRPLFGSWFDLLALDPSLSLQQRAPGGFLADLSIRGGTFGQTLVLIDGMRVNDSQTGHFHLDLPLPIEAIGSIELLKGSGSTLYGSDAIGGVVNVRTRVPEVPELRLFLGKGNFGTDQEHAQTAFNLGSGLSEQLTVARDRSTGFMPNRDYRNLALSSLSAIKWKPGAASILLAYSDRPFGAEQFYGNFPSWERTKTWFASLHQNFGERTEANFAWRRHTDLFVLFRDNPPRYTNRHALNSWQGNVRRRDRLPFNSSLSYGAEGFADEIVSNNLGTRSRVRGSAYVFFDVRTAKRYSLTAGIREEAYGAGRFTSSPSLSGAAWINSHFKLRGAATRAFRLPTYTDLYYSDPANRGNPNLLPEHANTYEGGADLYLNDRFRASATVFHRRETNVIDYTRTSPTAIWEATNFSKLRFTGVEASAVYEARGHRLSAIFAGLEGTNANGAVLLSKYVFNYPVRSAVLEWRGALGNSIMARTRIGVVERLSRDPYAVWDASASYSRGHIRPFLQLTNITSTVYQEIPGIPLPQRGVLGGIEIVFFGASR